MLIVIPLAVITYVNSVQIGNVLRVEKELFRTFTYHDAIKDSKKIYNTICEGFFVSFIKC